MFPDVPRTEIDAEQIAGFTKEWDHTSLAVDLLREVASYVCVAACIMGEQSSWSRDQAIVGGHAVRLYKLLAALLDQICQRRRETADIFIRLIFEACVNVRFLMQEWSPDLADSYVRASLRHERKLLDTIEARIAARNGDTLPIEERMLKSLDRTARFAGVPLESVDLKNKATWGGKHLAQKTREIGWIEAYDAVFGGMSHNVHGSWQDLYTHQLDAREDGRFVPDLEWSKPRPQPLFVTNMLVVQVIREIAHFLGGDVALESLTPLLNDLLERIEQADVLHETYLQGKQGPQI